VNSQDARAPAAQSSPAKPIPKQNFISGGALKMLTNFYRRVLVLFVFYCFLCSTFSVARADEGMWTFANPPLQQLKAKYGFEPTKEWLEHVRLSSVRLGGGTGAFVSPDGLVLTNHHIVRSSLAKLSTAEQNLLKTGFYAATRADDRKGCAGKDAAAAPDRHLALRGRRILALQLQEIY
jgi:S1-C subfamily serine protease